MASGLPLPTLLSAALVAFTVEFDNEAEHRMPHRTTRFGPSPRLGDGPFLVSQVMWTNVLQHVEGDGSHTRELHARSRTTRDSLDGLQRWRYVTVTGNGTPGARHGSTADDRVVRLTAGGRAAGRVWRPLADEIEDRWRARHGTGRIGSLRRSLEAVAAKVGRAVDLPDYLPIVFPTQNGKAEVPPERVDGPEAARPPLGSLDLSALVARTLLAFTLDFESDSRISLPISANTLRVLGPEGVRVRDLPVLTGVSKEANAMAVGFLVRHGCATVVPDAATGRGQIVKLTDKGGRAQAKYRRILVGTERLWEAQLGTPSLRALRMALEPVVGDDPTAASSPLFGGLEPYPDGWRASTRRPDTLPHYPMVLHRGGYPDGS